MAWYCNRSAKRVLWNLVGKPRNQSSTGDWNQTKAGWFSGSCKFRIQLHAENNWRLRWKKGVQFFTQKWTLLKTLQISHAVLFRCIKQCSVCFFADVCFVFKILHMHLNWTALLLWGHHWYLTLLKVPRLSHNALGHSRDLPYLWQESWKT